MEDIKIDIEWFRQLSSRIDFFQEQFQQLNDNIQALTILQAKNMEEISIIKEQIKQLVDSSFLSLPILKTLDAKLNDSAINFNNIDDKIQELQSTTEQILPEISKINDFVEHSRGYSTNNQHSIIVP